MSASMNVAAIDIGTNSVRLLITDQAGRELAREMHITRLGQAVDVTGTLQPEAIARTTEVLAKYAELLAEHRVARTRATATSAARDAKNSEEFFEKAQAALGVRPELLPGSEEAALSFRGATSGLSSGDGPFLVIDIGGGSTEFVLGTSAPEALISVNMGCVRMTERHFKSDPPTQEEQAACRADARHLLAAVKRDIPYARAKRVLGLAGTVTALGAMAQGLMHYDPRVTHGMALSATKVSELCQKLASVNTVDRRALLAEPKRAEVIVGGALLLDELMRELQIDVLTVSEADILDGLAASLRKS
jgi:exopolyphosphatase/guanosine-5'-triphosphate,3'-diphosphate pyrophosphatase